MPKVYGVIMITLFRLYPGRVRPHHLPGSPLETKQLGITSSFRRDTEAYYVAAKHPKVASIARIPYWMYGFLVVLGWNNAMTESFNPSYLAVYLEPPGAS